MWAEEKLKEAAKEWFDKDGWGIVTDPSQIRAFLAGCKYIINNTQKEVKG